MSDDQDTLSAIPRGICRLCRRYVFYAAQERIPAHVICETCRKLGEQYGAEPDIAENEVLRKHAAIHSAQPGFGRASEYCRTCGNVQCICRTCAGCGRRYSAHHPGDSCAHCDHEISRVMRCNYCGIDLLRCRCTPRHRDAEQARIDERISMIETRSRQLDVAMDRQELLDNARIRAIPILERISSTDEIFRDEFALPEEVRNHRARRLINDRSRYNYYGEAEERTLYQQPTTNVGQYFTDQLQYGTTQTLGPTPAEIRRRQEATYTTTITGLTT